MAKIANLSPSPSDWGFEQIRSVDPSRAKNLESAGSPLELIGEVVAALRRAIARDTMRFGIDGLSNDFAKPRATLQVYVGIALYDWFFNARSGYRARFWIGPDIGQQFNIRLIEELVQHLRTGLPDEIEARRIVVEIVGASRVERDIGAMRVSRDLIIESLLPSESKVWICERLIRLDGKDPQDIWFAVISGSSNAKLQIPRWRSSEHPKSREVGEGLRAPFPNDDYAWLDIKGGFLQGDLVKQQKSQDERARMIHECGWT